ncbi:50S ribosomal protein L20 [Candidatus Roizmanbacteria bacterium RIFCSPLOWO2_02_FULL_37_19]|uniref:Large ribosomal subunit protein bL20 n=1 Tax=Candidatus Roizmanbacteria bacterium RIFCSPHIGHO2_02_FULL_37_24 TaxID=1802037 RepID=A0A1F7GWF0_9BACT|nr:MAG: 50S ribosomal protein L20 [Candidatus Roizmanbacteria bacterium RIFCSPHIGHO2_01_FULL_38_41]OGK22906.1 MAG: 50S ribosomal protein L20 [Candidatus Roizmanbacteria bacterium RIFCSPHIGHO2_02_FULL_37_24]OGK33640.1 MAG: 50S ribosomal protein L20 [Candidatus Roizmanbacteria bacterium RIFCSPHIGHO2_12_FULL_37_23]OGK44988.1 MAG: 50S ribosomal protein L20 [Candidatus Roizmanbacteria bacterium RIFCSPLOWO2_01_FULL_37_57]OGK55292.1 MAG: 50S ribosomal protein L20 [Candidatus Roizmanbacteria bacterium 
MVRIKAGITTRRRHKKVLKQAKGYRMARRRLFKTAQEAVLHAGEYAFMGRKLRKRDFRSLWITRMNASLRDLGTTYSVFIKHMKDHHIELDRKILALLAVKKPKIFKQIVDEVNKT